MDYPCAKFGDFSFSRFGFYRATDSHTDSITEAGQRYTHATTVGVSNNNNNNNNTRTMFMVLSPSHRGIVAAL